MFWQCWYKAFQYDFDVSKVEYLGGFHSLVDLGIGHFLPDFRTKGDVKEN